jgi:hypothetical protein
VNTLEDRLRDAYRGAAETVGPQTIMSIHDQAARHGGTIEHRAGRRARVIVPLAAAAAVSLVAVLAAVVGPQVIPARQHSQATSRSHGRSTSAAPPAAGPYPRFFVALTGNGTSLSVRSATTGTLVTRMGPPSGGVHFAGLGTGNGHTFVAAVERNRVCRTWLYQFTLQASGQPSRLTPFVVPAISGVLPAGTIAVSASGQTIGYNDELCTGTRPSAYLAVMNLASKKVRRWTTPAQADVMSLSLTADGHLLGYNIAQTKLFASVARVLPTNAAPGSAAQRGRTIAGPAQFGASTNIASDVISADGSALYFTTNATGAALGKHIAGRLRVADLGTRRLSVLDSFAGLPVSVTADPSGRFLLLQTELGSGFSSPRLARLDSVTGKVTQLPAGWLGPDQTAVLAW